MIESLHELLYKNIPQPYELRYRSIYGVMQDFIINGTTQHPHKYKHAAPQSLLHGQEEGRGAKNAMLHRGKDLAHDCRDICQDVLLK